MSTVNELTSQAGFIFEGQLEHLGVSHAVGFPATPETAVVRVTNIHKGDGALSGYAGQEITVVLQPPVNLKPGDAAVFFTHGIHYGETLVVNELANVPPEATMKAQVSNAAQAAVDDKLTQRLAAADTVVTGTASAPRPVLGANMGTRHVSEHEPDWWVSTVKVESTEKGADAGPTQDVVFARSTDVAWYRSPKIKEGDRGIWLLHTRDQRGRNVPALASVDEFDFQPIDQLDRVRGILKSNTPK